MLTFIVLIEKALFVTHCMALIIRNYDKEGNDIEFPCMLEGLGGYGDIREMTCCSRVWIDK